MEWITFECKVCSGKIAYDINDNLVTDNCVCQDNPAKEEQLLPIETDKATTACFTGHRPSKFSFGYSERHPHYIQLNQRLQKAIETAITQGYTRFISGMAVGVDTWAAEIVLELQKEHPQIQLEAAIPCLNQEKLWPPTSQKRYRKLLEKANIITYVSKIPYRPRLMKVRNEYMVGSSSLLIAVFDGTPGGTAHAYYYAKAKGLKIFRIDPTSIDKA